MPATRAYPGPRTERRRSKYVWQIEKRSGSHRGLAWYAKARELGRENLHTKSVRNAALSGSQLVTSAGPNNMCKLGMYKIVVPKIASRDKGKTHGIMTTVHTPYGRGPQDRIPKACKDLPLHTWNNVCRCILIVPGQKLTITNRWHLQTVDSKCARCFEKTPQTVDSKCVRCRGQQTTDGRGTHKYTHTHTSS
jgi:hypothetical protein